MRLALPVLVGLLAGLPAHAGRSREAASFASASGELACTLPKGWKARSHGLPVYRIAFELPKAAAEAHAAAQLTASVASPDEAKLPFPLHAAQVLRLVQGTMPDTKANPVAQTVTGDGQPVAAAILDGPEGLRIGLWVIRAGRLLATVRVEGRQGPALDAVLADAGRLVASLKLKLPEPDKLEASRLAGLWGSSRAGASQQWIELESRGTYTLFRGHRPPRSKSARAGAAADQGTFEVLGPFLVLTSSATHQASCAGWELAGKTLTVGDRSYQRRPGPGTRPRPKAASKGN